MSIPRCEKCGKLMSGESLDPCRCGAPYPNAPGKGRGVISGPFFIALMFIPPILMFILLGYILYLARMGQ